MFIQKKSLQEITKLTAGIIQLNSRKRNMTAFTRSVGEDTLFPKRNIVFLLFLCLLFP